MELLHSTSDVGRWGEELAAQALIAHGYTVIERNWRCPAGEIDLIAQESGAWVFVEVKLRRGHSFGTPEEGVTARKSERLLNAGLAYIEQHQLDGVDWRIDVLAIDIGPSGKAQRLALYRDAVRADG